MNSESSRITLFSNDEQRSIQEKLDQRLCYNEIRQRPGANGIKLAYLEGWKAYSLANEVFGFNGWSSSILDLHTDYVDEKDARISLGVSCTVRVYLRDGTFHDDIGYGSSENQRSKAEAFGKAKKEAVTDGMKRALRCFGNRLGNCMYDKDFLKEVQRSSHHSHHHKPTRPPMVSGPSNETQKSTTPCLPTETMPELAPNTAVPIQALPPASVHSSKALSTSDTIHQQHHYPMKPPPMSLPSTFCSIGDSNTLIFAEDDYEDMDALLIEAATNTEFIDVDDAHIKSENSILRPPQISLSPTAQSRRQTLWKLQDMPPSNHVSTSFRPPPLHKPGAAAMSRPGHKNEPLYARATDGSYH